MPADRRLPTATDPALAFDVCIVGAGPAGITIAREFLGTDVTVCLIESGGDAATPAGQDLARGQTFGEPIHPPEEVCTRAFGGNSNAWHVALGSRRVGVRYMPLDDMDFEKRDGLPFSGWPFPGSHLTPFYRRAQAVCQSGPFAPDRWETADASRLPLDPAHLETTMFQFGPAEIFHERYRQELAGSGNIRILTNTSVVEVGCNADASAATRVSCVGSDGRRSSIAARVFVLATGGFENARLLLLSDAQIPGGIGNGHDVVGRYFHDHPLVSGGSLRPAGPDLFKRMALYDLRQVRGHPVMAHLKLPNEVSRRHQLLNVSACLFPGPPSARPRPSRRCRRCAPACWPGASPRMSSGCPGASCGTWIR